MRFVGAVAQGIEASPCDVEDDGEIYEEDAEVEKIGAMENCQHFKRKIDCAGNQGDPFSPGTGVPEAVAFGGAQKYVDNGHGDDCPELAGGQGIGPVEEHLSKVVVGADVQELQQIVGDIPGIVLDDQHDAEGTCQNQRGLRPFKRGDGAKHTKLGPGISGKM